MSSFASAAGGGGFAAAAVDASGVANFISRAELEGKWSVLERVVAELAESRKDNELLLQRIEALEAKSHTEILSAQVVALEAKLQQLIDAPAAAVEARVAAGIGAVKFVRVNGEIGNSMIISQLLVYARGDLVTNKARGKAVTGSAAADGGAYRNITDGNEGDRPYSQGLSIGGQNQWAQVDLSRTTDIQRVVVIMPIGGFHNWPLEYNNTLELLDASGKSTFTCDFTEATRSGTNNGTYTFDFDLMNEEEEVEEEEEEEEEDV